jgi:oligopeptide/dipeptide ABC transporter ATP-binding protein
MIPKIWELLEVTLFYLNFITVFLIYFLNKKNVSDLTINSERGIIHKLKSYFFLIWIVIGFLFINIGLLDFIPNTFGFNVGKITGILFILIGIGYFYYQNYIPYKLATKELSEQKIIIMDLKFLVFFIFGFVLIVLSYYSLLPVVYNFRSGFIAGYLLIIIGVGLFNKYNFIPNNSFKPNNNLLAKSNKYDIYFIIIFIAGIIIFSLGYSNIVPNLNTFLTVINIGYLTILASFVFFYFFSYNVRKSYFTNKFSAEYTSEKSNNSYLSSQKRFQIQLYSTIAELLLILFSLLGVILVTMGYLNLTPEIDGQQLGFYIGGLFFAIGLLIYYNFSSKQQRNFEDQEVLTTLKYVGLHPPLDYYNKFPHELSGGERQRVAIARAIIVNPEMIIADEPTSMLDVSIRASILDLLFNLKQKLNLTILFITHDLAVAKHFCNQIAIMYVGEIVETGLINEVFNNPRHPYTYTLLKSIPVPDPTYKTDFVIPEGEVPDAINPPSGCRFHPRCPFAEEICAKQKPGYEMISSTHKVACHFHSKLYSEKSLKIN